VRHASARGAASAWRSLPSISHLGSTCLPVSWSAPQAPRPSRLPRARQPPRSWWLQHSAVSKESLPRETACLQHERPPPWSLKALSIFWLPMTCVSKGHGLASKPLCTTLSTGVSLQQPWPRVIALAPWSRSLGPSRLLCITVRPSTPLWQSGWHTADGGVQPRSSTHLHQSWPACGRWRRHVNTLRPRPREPYALRARRTEGQRVTGPGVATYA